MAVLRDGRTIPRNRFRELYGRQCTGKRRFPSRSSANHALGIIRAKGMHSYQCKVCFGFHVGHPSD